jgi:hypothetical protein
VIFVKFLLAYCVEVYRFCYRPYHPAFPAPSVFGKAKDHAQLGRIAPRDRGCMWCNVIARSDLSAVARRAKAEATSDEAISHQTSDRHTRESGYPVRCGLSAPAPVSGILDHPPEPVIGRRVAPTRWRVTTTECGMLVRSPILTNFWHCGFGRFSFRTGTEARPGNEPSMVLAENRASKRVWQC